MGDKYYKAESKKEWYTSDDITTDHLQVGALLRIADAAEKIAIASEKMASNYTQCQNDRDRYYKWWQKQLDESARLGRRISALQGVITKLKKKKNVN